MEIKITLIRNGMTQSGKESRYIGITDESLCDEGMQLLETKKQESCYPVVKRLYASPAVRCIETAKLLYDGQLVVLANGLSPYDYGSFEGKTYDEIQNDPHLVDWVLGQADRLPGADSPYPAKYKAIAAFEDIMIECSERNVNSVAIVTHRSVMLSILRERCTPKLAYNNIDLEYGGGVTLVCDIYTKSLCVETVF